MSFSVDANNILQPLGVNVTRDSRYELLPGTRDYTEEIPGKAGEIDFGCDFEPRIIELHCVLEVLSANQPATIRTIAGQLNPLSGATTLTFADEPGKVYRVRYAGKIDVKRYPSYVEFVIPFKMYSPYITGTPQKSLVGSGTATNDGTMETPITVEIQGPVTSPTVTINGNSMTYTGTINAGSLLIIDTDKLTVTLDEANALPNYNGVFPQLQPGANTVVAAAAGTTTVRFYDRWI